MKILLLHIPGGNNVLDVQQSKGVTHCTKLTYFSFSGQMVLNPPFPGERKKIASRYPVHD